MQRHQHPANASVSHRVSHGNLHINVAGEFALSHVSAVHGLLERHYADCKRVFIDVRDVEGLTPLAQVHFKAGMPSLAPDPHKIFFKGKTGFDLALNGHRVLITPEAPQQHAHSHHAHGHHGHGHACKNNCPNCKCKNKKAV